MLPRTASRLEATLLLSRQAFPCPARLYSTPSKARNAPATATASALPLQPDFPFLPDASSPASLSSFLNRLPPLTVIPPPEPVGSVKEGLDPWFIDSTSHEMVGIIDACLHNFHDVKRAQMMLERLRSRAGSAALSTRLYNTFLSTYCHKAAKEPAHKKYWIDEAWELYEILRTRVDGLAPNTKTYAIMFDIVRT